MASSETISLSNNIVDVFDATRASLRRAFLSTHAGILPPSNVPTIHMFWTWSERGSQTARSYHKHPCYDGYTIALVPQWIPQKMGMRTPYLYQSQAKTWLSALESWRSCGYPKSATGNHGGIEPMAPQRVACEVCLAQVDSGPQKQIKHSQKKVCSSSILRVTLAQGPCTDVPVL